jgi:hypothetical protein
MRQFISSRIKPATATVLVLLVAAIGLAACGGSSKSSSTSASAAATKSGATAPPGSRFASLRECLRKDGIMPPVRTPGQPGGGFLGGFKSTLPKGMTRAQYLADVQKCGGGRFSGGTGLSGGRRFNDPTITRELAKFAACMREHGVNVPAPNANGKGPIFNTKGLNPSSAQFKAAESKCTVDLKGLFLRRGSTNGGPPTGSPPASGGESPSTAG